MVNKVKLNKTVCKRKLYHYEHLTENDNIKLLKS